MGLFLIKAVLFMVSPPLKFNRFLKQIRFIGPAIGGPDPSYGGIYRNGIGVPGVLQPE